MDSTEAVISLKSLSKSYKNLKAVNSLSLDVRSNEILGLLGPNGAGKTTTIRMICGLLKPESGQVLIQGKNWNDASELRKKIGYAPQENVFWPKLTCLEQLIFTGRMYDLNPRQSGNSAKNILQKLGLEEKSNSLASTLSGGMKRRLSLALALVHDPEILILDEPEAGLDPQSRLLVREYIKSLKDGKTIILSTHNMDEADRLSDRIAIIDRGELLTTDSSENLKHKIGKGDILELEISSGDGFSFGKLTSEFQSSGLEIRQTDEIMVIQGMGIISKIPEITVLLQKNQCKIQKMTLRENSLEDVFIHLTGRRLRS